MGDQLADDGFDPRPTSIGPGLRAVSVSLLIVASDLITPDCFGRRRIHEDLTYTYRSVGDIGVCLHISSQCSNVLRAGFDDGLLRSDDLGLLHPDDDGLLRPDDHGLLHPDHLGLLRSDKHGLLRSDNHGLLRSDNHGLLRSDDRLLSNLGVLRTKHGILRGQSLQRQRLLRRLLSRRIVRHWLGRNVEWSWVVNWEDAADRGLHGLDGLQRIPPSVPFHDPRRAVALIGFVWNSVQPCKSRA